MATTGAPAGWLEDYRAEGSGSKSQVGVILVHGFTGSPASMRPWAEYLHKLGYTVSVPRIPGHGTQWQDLNNVGWREWPAKVQSEIDELNKKCNKIFLCGLSMGGGNVLLTSSENQAKITGIVLVNPMIHIPGIKPKFRHIIARLKAHLPPVANDIKKPGVTEWGYDVLPTKGIVQLYEMLYQARKLLPTITTPLLTFHSVEDHVLPVSNTEIIMNEVGSLDKQRIELTNSYHVATMDNDAELIFENSRIFIENH